MSETVHQPAIPMLATARVAVIGLGYVGLPLAAEFARGREVLGFDIAHRRIEELASGIDNTLELEPAELASAKGLRFSSDPADLAECDTFIVTVPTPLDAHRRPDLTPLTRASETVGAQMKPGSVVIYESTVYPGATEEHCVPILEAVSGLTFNRDFTVGYSPERINPGDRRHRLPDIRKVTSGSTAEAAEFVDALYASIIRAGTHRASSIRVAEAAKVIENTQRDLNIALINELAMIFNRLGIDTEEVLKAAETKWNFLPFRPGLVGGHCIGVDPYYLTYKAEAVGCRPEIILAGRRTNDGMAGYAANRLVKAMIARDIAIRGSRVLVLGMTFKENCPDLRNTKVVDLVTDLREFGVLVDVFDPVASDETCREEYGFGLVAQPATGAYDGIVLAVAHDEFREMGAKAIRDLGAGRHVLFDLKHLFPAADTDLRL